MRESMIMDNEMSRSLLDLNNMGAGEVFEQSQSFILQPAELPVNRSYGSEGNLGEQFGQQNLEVANESLVQEFAEAGIEPE